jgi:hypothetical protein
MEPITLIFLGGLVSGVIIGDALDPIGINENDHLVKECTTKTSRSKIYDKDLHEYILNEYVDEICIGRYIPPERPILNAIKNKITH